MLFLQELLFALNAGPLRISFLMDTAAAEDYFLAVCHLEQLWAGFSIYNFDNFTAAFGAFAGFAIYDDRFHILDCDAKLHIFFVTDIRPSLQQESRAGPFLQSGLSGHRLCVSQ